MFERAAFAFAQSRLQSHNGRRPTEMTWQHLNASKSLGHYLEGARQTGLGPWVVDITANSDIHAVEASLRRHWRDFVQKVSSWLPTQWRPAARWTAMLADLPLTTQGPLTVQGKEPHSNNASELQSVASLQAWAERFRDLWPHLKKSDRTELEKLLRRLRRDLGPDRYAHSLDGTERRHQLSDSLERLLHHQSQGPLAVFAFLSLVAIDLQHLRAHLVHRCLFPETLDNR